MGKAKRRMFFDQVSEAASFTDREEALSLFFQKLEELVLSIRERGEENKLVFYHGLAGIGKTTLLNRLKYILVHRDFPAEGPMQQEAKHREILCSPEMANCKTISCNFEEKGTKIEMLLHLMEELTKELGFAFPLTAAALYRLGMDSSWKPKSKFDAIAETKTFGVCNEIIKILPVVGDYVDLAKCLGGLVRDRHAGSAWRHFEKCVWKDSEARHAYYFIQSEENSVSKIDERLDDFLAIDFSQNMHKWIEDKGSPIAIFMDTFEYYTDTQRSSLKADGEQWLRNLIGSVPYVLWVIAGRDSLMRGGGKTESDREWLELLEGEECRISKFSLRYTSEYLAKYNITDERLISAFHERSDGIPFILSLLRKRHEALKVDGLEGDVSQYDVGHDGIIERYLRYLKSMDNSAYNLISELSMLGDEGWTEGDISELKERMRYFDQSVYDAVRRDSVIYRSGDSFCIQRPVRRLLESGYRDENPEGYAYTASILKEHYLSRIECENPRQLGKNIHRLFSLCSDEEKENLFVSKISGVLESSHLYCEEAGDVLCELEDIFGTSQNAEFRIKYCYLKARVFDIRGDYKRMHEWYSVCHEISAESYGDDDLRTIRSLSSLAFSFGKIGNVKKPLELNRLCYEKRKVVLGEDHPDTLKSLNNLSYSLGEIGDIKGALELNRLCYEKRKVVLGEDHPDTLISLSNLAYSLGKTGDIKGEVELDRLCYEKRKVVLGEDHPDTLNSLSNLASSLGKTGDIKGEVELDRLCYEKSKVVLGEEHPNTLTSLNNLAYSLGEIGDIKGALELNRLCYEKSKEILGEDHPGTLTSLNNFASSLGKTGDIKGELELNRLCYEKSKVVLGEEHPDTLTSLNNFALALGKTGDIKGALKLARLCHEKMKDILGEDHPDTLASLRNIVCLLEMVLN